MTVDLEDLDVLYEAAHTKRWHTRHHVSQPLHHHIHGMLLTIVTLHPNPSAALLKSVTRHDLHESRFGDAPHDAKRDIPGYNDIEKAYEKKFWADRGIDLYEGCSEEDILWIEFADQYEAFLYLKFNQHIIPDDLKQVANRCAEKAKVYMEKLKTFGYFLDPNETVH